MVFLQEHVRCKITLTLTLTLTLTISYIRTLLTEVLLNQWSFSEKCDIYVDVDVDVDVDVNVSEQEPYLIKVNVNKVKQICARSAHICCLRQQICALLLTSKLCRPRPSALLKVPQMCAESTHLHALHADVCFPRTCLCRPRPRAELSRS